MNRLLALCLLLGSLLSARADDSPTLKQAAEGLFTIGVGLGIGDADAPEALALLKREFDYVTPENCMKPAATQRAEGKFSFKNSDAFMAFVGQHDLKAVGHCLVWAKDDRTPEWLFKSGDELATREVLRERMRAHMGKVLGRFGEQIEQWDVVNEALITGDDMWRKSSWLAINGGPDFIVDAFKVARAADPDAMLIYNDYRSELPGKRENLFKLVEYLKENGAPVDAIGLQGHYELDGVPFEELEFTLGKLRELGMKVVISEVDIDVVKRGKWWADGGKHREELAKFDPYTDGCPPEIQARLAEQYGKLFALYAAHADIIERVTFWNLHDGTSWLNHFPWDRANHPLLFDRDLKAKPAHKAVVDALLAAKAKTAK